MSPREVSDLLCTLPAGEREAVTAFLDVGGEAVHLAVKSTIPYHRAAGVRYTGLPLDTWEALVRDAPETWVVVYHRPPGEGAFGGIGTFLAGSAAALDVRRDTALEHTLNREPIAVWRM